VGLNKATPSGSEFYDLWTELFLRGSGPVFQAGIVRTGDPPREDPRLSVLALAEQAGVQAGDRILDAGCGVAGPATIIATHYPDVVIEAVTYSERQSAIARREVEAADLTRQVRVHVADYQQLPFRSGLFDQVLFLESTGYASDLGRTYGEAYRVLKPGGRLYIKDVFCQSTPLENDQIEQLETFDELWGCVRSKTMEESVDAIVRAGFEVTLSAPMQDIGTNRLVGSMFLLGSFTGLRPTELGEVFLRSGLNPPIEFGQIRAIRPIGASGPKTLHAYIPSGLCP
jgi:ubiquinone/menaquinone biosynthesis C-methylase UbiE